MIIQWFRQIKLLFNQPKKGDVFYGNSLDFMAGKPKEYVLHGLSNKFGDPQWGTIPGDETYRFTITNVAMPTYYICRAELLAINCSDNTFKWMERSQPRRIWKDKFKQMIIKGEIRK